MPNGGTKYFCSHGCLTPKTRLPKSFLSLAKWLDHYSKNHPEYHVCVVLGGRERPIVAAAEEIEISDEDSSISSTSSRVSVLTDQDCEEHKTEMTSVDSSDLVVCKKY